MEVLCSADIAEVKSYVTFVELLAYALLIALANYVSSNGIQNLTLIVTLDLTAPQ